MPRPSRRNHFGIALGVIALAICSVWVASAGALTAAPHEAVAGAPVVAAPLRSLPGQTLVAAPPAGESQPDDLTWLAAGHLDGGRALVWTEFQNGINPNGTPSSQYGATESDLVGFDPHTGLAVRSIPIWGHVDGVTGDPATDQLFITTNEDDNSAFFLVNPGTGAVTEYTYAPNPAVMGNGGTDAITLVGGEMYVSHSNPSDLTQPTTYRINLDPVTLVATLTPIFYDDSMATDALTNAPITMALTDPDTNYLMPANSPLYAGDLATISQGDGRLVFASHLGGVPQLTQLNLTDNVTGNLPPIDGIAVATSANGTLYGADAGAGQIRTFSTVGWPAGTVFVTEPNDNGNPLIGTLNLATGVITPLGDHLVSPKGLIFVAA
jgi:hypothetical protein